MTIRPAQPGDAEAIRQLILNSYGHYVARLGKPPGPMLDDYVRRVADGQVWVLDNEGALLGALVLEDVEGGALLLDNVAVDPSAQGKGHGRALMAFADEEARRRGHREVRLYTHALMTENQALYRRLGFQETGRVSEKGFERVYMAKPLDRT